MFQGCSRFTTRAVAKLGMSFATAAIVIASVAPANAASIKFSAELAPEAALATGTGAVKVTYDDVAHTLFIDTWFSGLSGLTTVAHIHCCTAVPGTGTVGVAVTPGTLPLFPVGVTQATYSTTIDLTLASSYTPGFVTNFAGGQLANAESALIAGMFAGKAYFNVHSTAFPGGEIRGFLAPVPEPGSLLLVGSALAALAARRRRR